VLTLCTVLVAGCWNGTAEDEEATFACERGFRPGDWRDQTLKTGQSIAKCDWLDGWSERTVREALGRWEYRTPRRITYDIGVSAHGLGPLAWDLTIVLDRRGGNVVDAKTRLVSY
jgi:hypothetical protein